MKIRVGFVGIGNWAQHGHVRVLQLLPEYALSAVYSQRADAAAAAAEKHGFRHVARTMEELVTHPEVDLVVVLTTTPQHEQAVRMAIAAGKDVYCEWPLTITSAKAEELRVLAVNAGVRHVVGLQRRLAPHNRFLQDLLAQGFIGKLRSVRMHVSMNYFQGRRPNALRWTVPPENFSSVVAIYGGHFLDMLFQAVGWPSSVAALMPNQFERVEIIETGEVFDTTTPDQLVLAGTLQDDAVVSVHIESGKRNGSGVQIDLTGDRGDIRITNTSAFGDVGDDYVVTGVQGDDAPMRALAIPATYDSLPPAHLPSAVLELAHLYAAHARDRREGTRTAPDFSDAVRMHRLLDAARLSWEMGQHVSTTGLDA